MPRAQSGGRGGEAENVPGGGQTVGGQVVRDHRSQSHDHDHSAPLSHTPHTLPCTPLIQLNEAESNARLAFNTQGESRKMSQEKIDRLQVRKGGKDLAFGKRSTTHASIYLLL